MLYESCKKLKENIKNSEKIWYYYSIKLANLISLKVFDNYVESKCNKK